MSNYRNPASPNLGLRSPPGGTPLRTSPFTGGGRPLSPPSASRGTTTASVQSKHYSPQSRRSTNIPAPATASTVGATTPLRMTPAPTMSSSMAGVSPSNRYSPAASGLITSVHRSPLRGTAMGIGQSANVPRGVVSPPRPGIHQLSPRHPAASVTPLRSVPVASNPEAVIVQMRLEDEIEMKRRTIADLENAHSVRVKEMSNAKINEQASKAAMANQHASTLERVVTESKMEREAATATMVEQVERNRDVTRQLQDAEGRRINTQSALIAEEEHNRTLKKDLHDSRVMVEELRRGADQVLQGRVAALDQIIEDKELENKMERRRTQETKKKLDEERSQRLTFQEQLEEFKTENARLSLLQQDLTVERNEYKASSHKLAQQLEDEVSLRREQEQVFAKNEANAERRLTELQELLRQRNKQVTEQEIQCLSINEQLIATQNELRQTTAEKTALKDRYDTIRQQLHDTQTQVETLNAKCTQQETLVTSHEQTIQRERSTIEQLRRQIEESHAKVGQLEETVQALELDSQRTNHLQDTVKVQKQTLERQHMDRMAEATRYDDLQSKTGRLEDHLKSTQMALRQTQQQEQALEGARRQVVDLTDKNDRTTMIVEDQQRELKQLQSERRQLKEEVQQLFGEKSEQEQMNGRLRAELLDKESVQSKNQMLEQRLQEKANEVTKLNDQSIATDTEMVSLKVKCESQSHLERAVADAQAENRKLMAAIESSDNLRREKESLLIKMDTLVQQKDAKISGQKQQLEQIAMEIENLQVVAIEREELRKRNKEMMERLQAAETEQRHCDAEKETMLAANNQLQQQVSMSNSKEDDVISELTACRSTLGDLQVNHGRTLVEAEQASKAKAKAEAQISDLEAHIFKLEKTVEADGTRLEAQQAQKEGLELSLATVEGRNAELTRDLESSQKNEVALREKYTEVVGKYSTLQEVHGNALDKAERNATLEGKVDALESIVARKDSDIRRLEGTVGDQKSRLVVAEDKANQMMRSESKNHELKGKLELLEQELGKLEVELTSKGKELIAKEQEIHRETLECKVLRDSVSLEREKVTVLEAEIGNLRQELSFKAQSEGKAAALQQLLDEAHADLNRNQNESNRLQQSLLDQSATPQAEALNEILVKEMGDYKTQHIIHLEVISALEAEQKGRTEQLRLLQDDFARSEANGRASLDEAQAARDKCNELERQHRLLVEKYDDQIRTSESEARKGTLEHNKLFALAQDYKERLRNQMTTTSEMEEKMATLEFTLGRTESQLHETQHNEGVGSVELDIARSAIAEHKSSVATLTHSLMEERHNYELLRKEVEAKSNDLVELQRRMATDNAVRESELSSHQAASSEYQVQISNLHTLLEDKQTTVSALNKELKSKDDHVTSMGAELDTLRMQHLSLQATLTATKQSCEKDGDRRVQQELTNQENEIAIVQQSGVIQRLEGDLDTERGCIAELRFKLEDADIETRALTEKFREREATLSLDLEKQKHRNDSLLAELEQLKRSLGAQQAAARVEESRRRSPPRHGSPPR